jgi:integrase
MQRNLTERFVQTLKPEPGKRKITVFDAKTTGLAVIVEGGARTYKVMTRDPAGKQRWAEVKDGNASVTSLALARKLAPEGIARLKNGKEAFPKLEPADAPKTYAQVVEQFIEQYAKPRQRTWPETARVLRAVPWGKRPITSITLRDAYAYLDPIAVAGQGSKARVANAWLRKLWRWAAKREIVEAPIMDLLDIETERRVRDRVYNDGENAALWNAHEGLSPQDRAYVKLLILLGVRKNELAKMRRSELDDPDGPVLWTIPFERTKARKTTRKPRVYVVPLPPLARRVLKPLLTGDLIFPGRHRGKAFDPGSPFTGKVRDASGISDWYPHAHRHTIATWMENEGASEFERALILNHAGTGSVTADYSHGYPEQLKRQWLERWANHIAEVVSPGVELLA